MTKTFSNLTFTPNIHELVPPGTQGTLNIFTGINNSGKSAYLKQIIDHPGKLYIGVNRFYSFHHLSFYSDNSEELNHFFSNLQNTKYQAFQNFEGAFFNANTALTRLSNDRRAVLFETFGSLFGQTIEVRAENPNNDFSNRYVSVDGDSLSVTSSGTRLFLGLLAALMDERFNLVAIDEPELGLSPPLQRRLSDVIMKPEFNERLFPHRPNIVLSTHSHLFLDKARPENNWIVSRDGTAISSRRCKDFSELHDIQLRLLGNDLGELFLPHAVLFVEGETDKLYLDQVLKRCLPEMKIVTQDCGGDIAQRLNFWAQSLGDIQVSPYRDRTFAVYDKVEQAGLDRVCARLGLPDANKVKWSGNGIEYMYPAQALREIFRDSAASAAGLAIEGDYVRYRSISYKKMELCRLVCDRLTDATEYPDELETKLLSVLRGLQA